MFYNLFILFIECFAICSAFGLIRNNNHNNRKLQSSTSPLFTQNYPRSKSIVSYNTTRFSIYIESTDSFGVAFYATYPVYLERSICNHLGISSGRIKTTKIMKYKSPSRLGDNLLFACDDRGGVICSNEQTKDQIFSAKKVSVFEGSCIQEYQPILDTSYRRHSSKYRVYSDEVQYTEDSIVLPTRTVFNLFERGRTDVLGGPATLAASTKSTEAKHVYVGRISEYEFLSDLPIELNSRQFLELSVISHTIPIGTTTVEFYQQIVFTEDTHSLIPSDMQLLAKARVTCICVDALSGQATSFDESLHSLFV